MSKDDAEQPLSVPNSLGTQEKQDNMSKISQLGGLGDTFFQVLTMFLKF